MSLLIARQQWQNGACRQCDGPSKARTMVGAAMEYDYVSFLRELGARVKKLRLERKLTHRQMISLHGFHLNQLHRIESGDPVSVQTLLKLCSAFDLTLDNLVQGLGVGTEETVDR